MPGFSTICSGFVDFYCRDAVFISSKSIFVTPQAETMLRVQIFKKEDFPGTLPPPPNTFKFKKLKTNPVSLKDVKFGRNILCVSKC